MYTSSVINIIGAGLAGCEAAYQAAQRGIKVRLYDIKPDNFTEAHSNPDLAELVCSNSLKSDEITNACGLLKQEMRLLDSLIIRCADKTRVPAGSALAVDRGKFARLVTEEIRSHLNIEFITGEVQSIFDGINIIASGPLTTAALSRSISGITGSDNLYFYDAAAPIVDGSTIDYSKCYFMDRYGKGQEGGDYLNCPLNKEEYYRLITELTGAKKAELKSFENLKVFEGCMPVEVMAARGAETLRFGPLKPVGLNDPETGARPYAVVQLRKENMQGSYYNMVGFQTNLTFSEQRRVFSIIPALKNCEFIKYGVMHRNSFINSPALLTRQYNLKSRQDVFFAGQICGVEGYVESAASGLYCGINAANLASGRAVTDFPQETVMGALSIYISSPQKNFQPMNANFALLPPLSAPIRDKRERAEAQAKRSLAIMAGMAEELKADINFI